MASNLIVARGGVEFVPPISLAFWRWTTVFVLLIPFFYKPILKKIKSLKDEFLNTGEWAELKGIYNDFNFCDLIIFIMFPTYL